MQTEEGSSLRHAGYELIAIEYHRGVSNKVFVLVFVKSIKFAPLSVLEP